MGTAECRSPSGPCWYLLPSCRRPFCCIPASGARHVLRCAGRRRPAARSTLLAALCASPVLRRPRTRRRARPVRRTCRRGSPRSRQRDDASAGELHRLDRVRCAGIYLDGEARQGRFTGWLCLTLAAVILLVISGQSAPARFGMGRDEPRAAPAAAVLSRPDRCSPRGEEEIHHGTGRRRCPAGRVRAAR